MDNQPESSTKKRIKIRYLFLWVLLSLPFYFILSSINVPILKDPALELLIMNIWFYGLILIWIYLSCKFNKISITSVFGELPTNKKWIMSLLVVFSSLFLSLGSFHLLYFSLSFIFPELVLSIINENPGLSILKSAYPALYTTFELISAVLIAPIVEEFLFRGVILPSWIKKMGVKKAIIFSSLLFGILHINIIGGAVVGVITSLLYIKYRSLVVPILFHMINNGLVSLVSFLIAKPSSFQEMSLGEFRETFTGALVFIAISLPFIAWFFYRNWPKKDKVLELEKVELI